MNSSQRFAIALLGLVCWSTTGHGTELFSDNFETSASDAWALWTGYPNATVTDNQNRAVENTGSQIYGAPDGTTLPASIPGSTRSGKLWQLYWYEGQPGTPLTSATFKQWTGGDVTAMKGQTVSFDASTFTSSYDAYSSGNSSAQMFVKYFADGYSYIGGEYKTVSTNATNSWIANNLTFTVPTDAGLSIIQMGFDNNQANWGGGSVYVDNVSVSTVPEPASVTLLAVGGGLAAVVATRRRAPRQS